MYRSALFCQIETNDLVFFPPPYIRVIQNAAFIFRVNLKREGLLIRRMLPTSTTGTFNCSFKLMAGAISNALKVFYCRDTTTE